MTHSVYVFDAYGTLFDVHAAVRRHQDLVGPDGPAFSDMWRAKQLEYSWVHALMGAHRDFWTLTQEALDHAFARFPAIDRRHRATLLDAYRHLDCYPEVPKVLKMLKDRGARVAILSNGTPDMLASAVRSAGLDLVVDDIFSADAAGTFKTAPGVYELVTNAYRIYPGVVSFQSSNRWDIAGATRFGFRTVWVNRAGLPEEYAGFGPALILPALDSLA